MIKHNPYAVPMPGSSKSIIPQHTLEFKDVTCSHTPTGIGQLARRDM